MKKFSESVSCILPAYNELENLESTVDSCREALVRLFDDFEIIIVDDGSSDGTKELARQLAADDPQVRVIHHQQNLGYGAALRAGFSAARNPLVFFTDADGQFKPLDLENFIPHLAENDMVVGFRSPRSDPWLRVLYGKLFSALIRGLFRIPVQDVNCAFKVFRRRILDGVTLRSPGALINAELLILAREKGIIPVELPVSHFPRQHGRATGGSLKVILLASKELIALIYRFFLKKNA
jgi:glycosyltransferase involved in cell wall biosynthesis